MNVSRKKRLVRMSACRSDLADNGISTDAMGPRALCDLAKRSGTRRVAFRVQGEYPGLYESLIGMGARVRWTDLRMSLVGYPEARPVRGVVLSNWEI